MRVCDFETRAHSLFTSSSHSSQWCANPMPAFHTPKTTMIYLFPDLPHPPLGAIKCQCFWSSLQLDARSLRWGHKANFNKLRRIKKYKVLHLYMESKKQNKGINNNKQKQIKKPENKLVVTGQEERGRMGKERWKGLRSTSFQLFLRGREGIK